MNHETTQFIDNAAKNIAIGNVFKDMPEGDWAILYDEIMQSDQEGYDKCSLSDDLDHSSHFAICSALSDNYYKYYIVQRNLAEFIEAQKG